jgi:hypothetical protein
MGQINILMKHFLLPVFLFITHLAYSQSPIQSVTKNYFRTHPFDMKFSSFIQSLQKDPWFTLETYSRRTDTSFFFLSGIYKNFNPFKFSPLELKFVVAEEEIIHKDSLHTRDTVINMQLIAVTDTGSAKLGDLVKEFKRFHNNHAKKFYDSMHNSYTKNGAVLGEIESLFIYPLSIAPVTFAWGAMTGTSQYVFTVTIRFKVKMNIADYIFAPGESVYSMNF